MSQLTELEKLNIRTITTEELSYSWGKFLLAFVRQVMKKANITEMTPEIMAEIQAGMANVKPMEQAGALTDDDVEAIVNSEGGK
jgi:hypothetical protein